MSQDKHSKTDQADQPRGEILVYQAGDGETKVEVSLRDETVWLTLNQLADLFEVNNRLSRIDCIFISL